MGRATVMVIVNVITLEHIQARNVTNLVVLVGQIHVRGMEHVMKLQENVIVNHSGTEWLVRFQTALGLQTVMESIQRVKNHQKEEIQDVLIVNFHTRVTVVNINVFMVVQLDLWKVYGRAHVILVTMV